MEKNSKLQAYQIGIYVFIILAVLTAGEYMLGSVGATWWSILIFIAILKAWFVVQNYMHLPRLFNGEG
jgi:cytochrome c oxidase subunit IV